MGLAGGSPAPGVGLVVSALRPGPRRGVGWLSVPRLSRDVSTELDEVLAERQRVREVCATGRCVKSQMFPALSPACIPRSSCEDGMEGFAGRRQIMQCASVHFITSSQTHTF